jgi:hypothetical protein
MKRFVLSILSFTVFTILSCNKPDDLKLSVKDTDSQYKFSAQYDQRKTIAVQQYLNTRLKPNRIFSDHTEDVEKDIKLTDGTVFHLESSPGKLEIELEKKQNSSASYQNMREVCLEVRDIVMEK